jgi:transposase
MTEVPPLPDALPDDVRATMPPLVAAYVAALEAVVATVPALAAQVAGLQERVATLEARLGQTSVNSSRPPSSDPPGTRSASEPPPRGRRPGGQPGHRGTFRLLAPEVQVSHRVHHLPQACGRCGMALPVAAGPDDPPDWRHQVVDVPPVAVEVTEHLLAARTCGRCGQVTRAGWPAGVPHGVIGPHLVAMLALLTGRYRLSKREAAACLRDLVGVDLAVGTVSAIEQQVSAALAPLVAEARAAVQAAPAVNMDETGWRQGRQRAWLWTVVTALVTVFHIDRSRGAVVAQTLLGPDWAGIVGSDRFAAYRWLAPTQRQVCWAHLKRDFQKLVDWGAGPRPVGVRLLAIHAEVFEQWHRFRAGELERADLMLAIARLAAELRAVVEAGVATGHPVAQPLCRALLTVWPALWTFVLVEGVEPTNNAAEQALRPAVLWRKGSFGTQSGDGSRFVERMLTVTATCRQQGRRVLDVLVAAIIAAQRGQLPPSLLPATT